MVKYCIVGNVVVNNCKLQYSLSIAINVILSNLVKAICMALTLFVFKHQAPLVTVGDAVASFLAGAVCTPGTRLKQTGIAKMPTVTMHHDFKQRVCDTTPNKGDGEWPQAKRDGYGRMQRKCSSHTIPDDLAKRLHSKYFVAFCIAIPSVFYSLRGMPRSVSGLWKIEFGTVNDNDLVNYTFSIFGSVLANTPQSLLLYLYLAYNALYTNVFVAHELLSFPHERKALRVTAPQGKQRDNTG